MIRRTILHFALVAVMAFLLSVGWEFALEPIVEQGSGPPDGETDKDRWEYVVTATSFALLSLSVPLWLAIRSARARTAADEALARAATVYQHILEGVMITDPDGRILAVNPAFTTLTGYPEAEVLGRTPRFLKSGHQDQAFYDGVWAAIRADGYWQGELLERHRDGHVFPVREQISALRDPDDRVVNYLAIFSDMSEIKRSEERLEYQAHHDSLTGLPNRLMFNATLEHALGRARRDNRSLAVMFLDLDHFKHVNDCLGHPVGDQVLSEVGRRLESRLRGQDTVARLGGDEFTVLIEDLENPDAVSLVARKLLTSFETPILAAGQELHITASIGISLFPEDGRDATTLLRNADSAMYRAKDDGRNTHHFYTRALTESAYHRVHTEAKLRQALERQEFVLHYQPQFSLRSGHITGAEALLRWMPADGSVIPPGRFIPILEDTGLINPVFEWVLRESCLEWRRLRSIFPHPFRIAVNVSSRQFQRYDLAGAVRTIVEETGMDPRFLEIEITESALLRDPAVARGIINEIKALGIGLAIDDFGTGYSSLSYLQQFPVDRIKVDRSFIADITRNSERTALVSAIVHMSRVLDLEVVAEGAESIAQLALLRELGCDQVQGFVMSKPVPADLLREIANRRTHHGSEATAHSPAPTDSARPHPRSAARKPIPDTVNA